MAGGVLADLYFTVLKHEELMTINYTFAITTDIIAREKILNIIWKSNYSRKTQPCSPYLHVCLGLGSPAEVPGSTWVNETLWSGTSFYGD